MFVVCLLALSVSLDTLGIGMAYAMSVSYTHLSGKTMFGSTWETQDTYVGTEIDTTKLSGIQSVTIDGVDQGISSFFITAQAGTVNKRLKLNLYVEKGASHTIVVTDTNLSLIHISWVDSYSA